MDKRSLGDGCEPRRPAGAINARQDAREMVAWNARPTAPLPWDNSPSFTLQGGHRSHATCAAPTAGRNTWYHWRKRPPGIKRRVPGKHHRYSSVLHANEFPLARSREPAPASGLQRSPVTQAIPPSGRVDNPQTLVESPRECSSRMARGQPPARRLARRPSPTAWHQTLLSR